MSMRKPKNPKSKNIGKKATFPKDEAFKYFCTLLPNNRYPTYRDVAKKFGFKEFTVSKYGADWGWHKKRDEILKRNIDAWQEGREELIKKIEKEQFDQMSKLEAKVLEKLNLLDLEKTRTIDLKNLADALKITQNQKRIILGLPTEVTKADITNRNIDKKLPSDKLKKMDEFLTKQIKIKLQVTKNDKTKAKKSKSAKAKKATASNSTAN